MGSPPPGNFSDISHVTCTTFPAGLVGDGDGTPQRSTVADTHLLQFLCSELLL
jgi:hypothetical protein